MADFHKMRDVLSGYMPQLDGLRGLAILAVLFHNAALHGLDAADGMVMKASVLLVNTGWVGVQLFFVLSGFLITGILLDGKGAPRQLRNFYMRRALRIFPVYYVFLIVVFVALPFFSTTTHWPDQSHAQQVWYWVYLINWLHPYVGQLELGHIWSLAIEEQFYILWPLLVIFVSSRTLTYICLGLIVSAVAVRWSMIQYDPAFAAQAAYTFTVARWDALAIGALLAVMVRQSEGYQWWAVWAVRLAWVLAGLIVVQVLFWHAFDPVNGMLGFLNQTTAALLFCALLFLCIQPRQSGKPIVQFFAMQVWLRFIGKYSYAIYIFHLPLKQAWFASVGLVPAALPGSKQWLIMLYNFSGITAISTVVAVISWYLLEQPFLKLKRFFADTKSANQMQSTSSKLA